VLDRARSTTEERILWADAICINPKGLEERGHQIHLMSSIFRNTRHVLAFIGDDSGTAGDILQLVDKYNDEKDPAHLHANPIKDEPRKGAPYQYVTNLVWVMVVWSV
jgi:Heterokaryon incompatibility protein (HET)